MTGEEQFKELYRRYIHREGAEELLEWMERETDFFTAHAQPDFQGTLDGGRSIIFEAKYTTTDAMKRDVLTETQMETLERHHRCGALAAVCVGIQDRFFFVPWPVWRDMKEAFGHMNVSAAELEDFRVRFTGAVLFLDYAHKIGGRWITGADCEIERWRRSK